MSFMPEETYKQIICYMKFMHIIYAYLCIFMHICSGSEAIMKSFCGWASFLGGLKNGSKLPVMLKMLLYNYLSFRLTWKIPLFFPEKVSAFFRSVSGLIPGSFQKNTGNRPGKKRKHFLEKELSLLSFKVRVPQKLKIRPRFDDRLKNTK